MLRGDGYCDGQSEEEIERLTVNESMSPHEMLLHLLKRGELEQKRAVLRRLPDKFPLSSSPAALQSLFQAMQNVTLAEDAPSDIRLECVDALHRLVSSNTFPTEQLVASVLPLGLKLARRECPASDSIRDVGATLLCSIALEAPHEVLLDQVLPAVLRLTDVSEVDNTREDRIRGAQVMDALLERLTPDEIRERCSRRIIDLCQDTSSYVREVAATQLSALLRISREDEELQETIVSELTELLADEEPSVRVLPEMPSLAPPRRFCQARRTFPVSLFFSLVFFFNRSTGDCDKHQLVSGQLRYAFKHNSTDGGASVAAAVVPVGACPGGGAPAAGTRHLAATGVAWRTRGGDKCRCGWLEFAGPQDVRRAPSPLVRRPSGHRGFIGRRGTA